MPHGNVAAPRTETNAMNPKHSPQSHLAQHFFTEG